MAKLRILTVITSDNNSEFLSPSDHCVIGGYALVIEISTIDREGALLFCYKPEDFLVLLQFF